MTAIRQLRPKAPLPEVAAENRLLNDKQVAAMLGLGTSTFHQHVKAGKAPQPVRVGTSTRWPLSEILAHIEGLKAARCAAAA